MLGHAQIQRDKGYDCTAERKLGASLVEHLRTLQEANQSPITISQALAEARKALPRDTIIVTDSSCPQNQVHNEFPVYGPKQHITAGGFSGIGFALPAAIGAKLGVPDKPVVCTAAIAPSSRPGPSWPRPS